MKRYFMPLLASVILSSCQFNDDNDDTNQTPVNNFYALQPGNSWVYHSFEYDQIDKDYKLTEIVDSVAVTGFKTINGNTYSEVTTKTSGSSDKVTPCSNVNGEKVEFLRDSIGFLVNEKGEIHFSRIDKTEIKVASYDWADIYIQLQEDEVEREVEAGKFICLSNHRYGKYSNGENSKGTSKLFYSDGIGLIEYSCASASGNMPPEIIKRLVSHKLKK